ncbi:class I SAM-dependent methyltransferase [Senegalia massiliensis]|uniref:Methyltransferase domain-containing protein n=1 Tax=Senegalia massiliensis TaxID=1720316 RepID=A0A845QZW7_9CLOT|nr:methyltransferase [Senegalia massiliensis]NBI08015.1 methyltransferase domain-containing protein [Senegalia massiliensis]
MTYLDLYIQIDKYLESKLFFQVVEMKIFDYFHHSTTKEKVAQEMKISIKRLEPLLRVLIKLGWVEKDNEKLINNEKVDKFLYSKSSYYIGEILIIKKELLDFEHIGNLLNGEESKSKRIYDFDRMLDVGAKEIEYFRVDTLIKEAAQLFESESVKSILDLGGGSGLFALELALLYPEAQVRLFDRRSVLDRAKSYIKKRVPLDRLDYQEGDFISDDFGKDYDLIIASGIIDFAYNDVKAFLRKLKDGIASNGYIFLYSASLLKDDALINRELRWLSGRLRSNLVTVSKEEIEHGLEDAGLEVVKKTEDLLYPIWILRRI